MDFGGSYRTLEFGICGFLSGCCSEQDLQFLVVLSSFQTCHGLFAFACLDVC